MSASEYNISHETTASLDSSHRTTDCNSSSAGRISKIPRALVPRSCKAKIRTEAVELSIERSVRSDSSGSVTAIRTVGMTLVGQQVVLTSRCRLNMFRLNFIGSSILRHSMVEGTSMNHQPT